MIITKKVLVITKDLTNNGLFRYDFLDLESNLPFSIYSTTELAYYSLLEPYTTIDLDFNLVLQNTKDKISWKLKAVTDNEH